MGYFVFKKQNVFLNLNLRKNLGETLFVILVRELLVVLLNMNELNFFKSNFLFFFSNQVLFYSISKAHKLITTQLL